MIILSEMSQENLACFLSFIDPIIWVATQDHMYNVKAAGKRKMRGRARDRLQEGGQKRGYGEMDIIKVLYILEGNCPY